MDFCESEVPVAVCQRFDFCGCEADATAVCEELGLGIFSFQKVHPS